MPKNCGIQENELIKREEELKEKERLEKERLENEEKLKEMYWWITGEYCGWRLEKASKNTDVYYRILDPNGKQMALSQNYAEIHEEFYRLSRK